MKLWIRIIDATRIARHNCASLNTIFILIICYFQHCFFCRKSGFAVCNLHLQNREGLAVRFAQSCLPRDIFKKTGAAVKLWWVILKIILLKFSRHCRLDQDNYMVVYSLNSFGCLLNRFSFPRYFWLFTVFCNKWFDTVLYMME